MDPGNDLYENTMILFVALIENAVVASRFAHWR
jgi:hypothetical protein